MGEKKNANWTFSRTLFKTVCLEKTWRSFQGEKNRAGKSRALNRRTPVRGMVLAPSTGASFWVGALGLKKNWRTEEGGTPTQERKKRQYPSALQAPRNKGTRAEGRQKTNEKEKSPGTRKKKKKSKRTTPCPKSPPATGHKRREEGPRQAVVRK